MSTVTFGKEPLTIEDIVAVAKRRKDAAINRDPAYAERIEAGSRFLDDTLKERGGVYGVTTGYGDSCDKTVPFDRYFDLPIHLSRFHGCGLGRHFDAETTRAILATRLNSMAQGYSGVSYALMEGFETFLRHDILPLIPEEGSVGASGDLTPLSYIAGALIGERQVRFKDQEMSSAEAMKAVGMKPHRLRPKEALAIMNGTAAMTAIACLAFDRARYLADLACRVTAMASIALKGNIYHFDPKLFVVKPHPGQNQAAANIRLDLGNHEETGIMPDRLQDPYSIRCAPHVIGVFYDAEPLLRQMIENELNSANDNPIIDPASASIMHGGHFYGGHIAFAMDSLKNIVANLADLLDRQLAVLVDEKFNRKLPPNLSGTKDNYSLNHGFKAVQIGVSAWTAEALKLTMPASVFSRSTECHNQDKVSMGTIAARDAVRVIELVEQVAAACLMAVTQACNIRHRDHGLAAAKLKPVQATIDQVNAAFAFLDDDRPLEGELRRVIGLIRAKHWSLPYAAG
jgi:histidine ammonia-lyase